MSLIMQASLATAAVIAPSSFEEAYREHAQTVARWARQLAGVDVDVEDVVQEVFMVVSRQLSAFRGEARFTSWLFEITRKIVANHRRRQRWLFWRSNKDALASIPSPERDPLAELERRQDGALFYQALDKLPEKYRTVLVLYEVEGLTTQQMADLLSLNLSTLKVHLHRAREKFLVHYQQLLKKGTS
jgi:RNA polymerase sigma-70 factor (ECF subfamily)